MTDNATREGGCAIAVMAKAPRAGHVKTRLVPPLTPEAASALSASFLRDITANILVAARDAAIHSYIAYAPAGLEAAFDGIVTSGTRLVLADGSSVSAWRVRGFGRCLLHAAQSLLVQGHDAVCLLNSDSPNLPTSLLSQAARVLAENGDRVVLGPADDGGYYLIGMTALHVELFEDIDWSTGRVAEQTRQRARECGLAVVELATWYDVDDAAALLRLCRDLDTGAPLNGLRPYAAAATVGCIERLLIQDRLSAA